MSYIRTYTATLVIPAGATGGTVKAGNTFDPVNGWGEGGAPVNGQLMQVQLQQGGMGTALATVFKTVGQGGPQLTLLNVSNQASDGWYAPRLQMQNTLGVNLGTTVIDRMAIDDYVQMVVTGGTAGGTVIGKMLVYV